jgi:hypothetical protein
VPRGRTRSQRHSMLTSASSTPRAVTTWGGCQAGLLEHVGFGRLVLRELVHGVREGYRDDVYDKLSRLFDVVEGVLGRDVAVCSWPYADTQRRRLPRGASRANRRSHRMPRDKLLAGTMPEESLGYECFTLRIHERSWRVST